MGVTLQSYSSKQQKDLDYTDRHVVGILEKQKPGTVLVIQAGGRIQAKGFSTTVVDNDLGIIQRARKLYPQVHYEYSGFPAFARRMPKNAFDCIVDNGYSMKLRRQELARFYKEASKLLKYGGVLVTKAPSVADPYCKQHCPKRRWTTIGKSYVNFFAKDDLIKVLDRNGFVPKGYERAVYETEPGTYHLVSSVQKAMKL